MNGKLVAAISLPIAAFAATACAASTHVSAAQQADVTVKPPSCRASQLQASYLGSMPGAGNDLGTIVLRDAARRSCRLTGPISITGLDAAGHVVTTTITYRQVGQLRENGASPARENGAMLRKGLVASIPVWAEYRDDPASANGLCTGHQVEPATWRITLPSGTSLRTRNADPAGNGNLTPDNGLLTCRGQLNRARPVVIAKSVY